MQTNNNHIQKNKVYAPIFLGLALFFITLVLYPAYISYTDKKIQVLALENAKQERQSKIDEIKKIQDLFAGTGSNDIKAKVQKYNKPFDSSNIMEVVMVNKFTKFSDLSPASVNVGNISVDKGRKLPSWLSMANVSVTISADNPNQIIEYITYLTTESPLAFTIDSINLPLDTSVLPQDNSGLSVTIALWVYYYE